MTSSNQTPGPGKSASAQVTGWSPRVTSAVQKLSAADTALISDDAILVYRHERWHWFVQAYLGHTKAIATMAILTNRKLARVIESGPPGDLDKRIRPIADLPEDIQQELRCKLLPAVDDYLYLLDRGLISISGGATTEDTTTPQLSSETRREVAGSILTGRGGGWFQFWSTWHDIEKALHERDLPA